MNNVRSYTFAILMSLALVLTPIVAYGILTDEENGIHAHPDGNAVYIEGEACVVNTTTDISLVDFTDYMIWCSTQHMEYLSAQETP